MENIKPWKIYKKIREIDSFHLTSFLAWTFLNFLAHCVLGYPSGTKLWIGGQDLAKSNQWAWSTGDLIGGYFNFDPSINSESGDCLNIILPNDLTWKKSNCNGADSNHGFIAEKG